MKLLIHNVYIYNSDNFFKYYYVYSNDITDNYTAVDQQLLTTIVNCKYLFNTFNND